MEQVKNINLVSTFYDNKIDKWLGSNSGMLNVLFSYGVFIIKRLFLEIYVYSHRLRTLFVAGEHCDYDTTAWATKIFDVSTIYLLSSYFMKPEKNVPVDLGSYAFFAWNGHNRTGYICLPAWFNLRGPGWIQIKFSMDIMPLGTTQKSYFSIFNNQYYHHGSQTNFWGGINTRST